MTFPVPITPEELREKGYLKSMTPAEELKTFLHFRGMCLWEHRRNAEALLAFSMAHNAQPNDTRIIACLVKLTDIEYEEYFKQVLVSGGRWPCDSF